MARTALTVTTDARDGSTTAPAQVNGDVTNGNYVADNDGNIYIDVENTHATLSRTVTVHSSGEAIDGLVLPNEVCTIPAVSTRRIGPWSGPTFNQTYNDGTNDHINSVLFDISGSSGDIKFRVRKLPRPLRN